MFHMNTKHNSYKYLPFKYYTKNLYISPSKKKKTSTKRSFSHLLYLLLCKILFTKCTMLVYVAGDTAWVSSSHHFICKGSPGSWHAIIFVISNTHYCLKKFQTGVHYMSVKIYSSLPICIKNEINNTKNLNLSWRNFYLRTHFIHWKNFTISHTDSFQFFIFIDHFLTLINDIYSWL